MKAKAKQRRGPRNASIKVKAAKPAPVEAELDPADWRAGFQVRLQKIMQLEGGNMAAFAATLSRKLPVDRMRVVRWFRPTRRKVKEGEQPKESTTLPSADDLAAILATGWNVNRLLSGLGPERADVTRLEADLAADLYRLVSARLQREGWTAEDVERVFDSPDGLMNWVEDEAVKSFELWVGRRKFFNRKGQQVGEAITLPPPAPQPAPVPHDGPGKPLPKSARRKGGR